ncbi:MAG: GNAT family N-acetyltransferase [Salaquimonas sp.]
MTNPAIFVRTASKNDLAKIRDLLVETWHATYDSIFGTDMVTRITDKWHSIEALEQRLTVPVSEFVVADDGKTIHGMAFASQKEKTVTLHQLYVLPSSQGKGIGTELMQEIFFCFDSAETISLDVQPENTKAVGFYIAGGFMETGTIEEKGPDGLLIPHITLSRSLDL